MRADIVPGAGRLPRIGRPGFGAVLIAMLALWQAASAEISGNIAAETRLFTHAPQHPGQQQHSAALSAELEYYRDWDNGAQSFTFTPFVRIDNADRERTHADLRELTWLYAADNWELRAGWRRVFWGVTESVHLVDIINQTDAVENLDGEDKLGELMLNLALIQDWGTLDVFVMPGFRERSFPGSGGRLRTQPRVATALAAYESPAAEWHTDLAVRWSHSIGDYDIGVSHFYGTARNPLLQPVATANGVVLRPFYPIINQTSLDLQATLGDWLWKLEAISHDALGERYTAAAAGFEYTLYGLFDSATDLGLLSEYLFDDRGDNATTPFEDDLFIGLRLTLNDVQDSQLLAGVIKDFGSDARLFTVEASRRIGESWKLTIEGRFFNHQPATDRLFSITQDDHIQAELAWYF